MAVARCGGGYGRPAVRPASSLGTAHGRRETGASRITSCGGATKVTASFTRTIPTNSWAHTNPRAGSGREKPTRLLYEPKLLHVFPAPPRHRVHLPRGRLLGLP